MPEKLSLERLARFRLARLLAPVDVNDPCEDHSVSLVSGGNSILFPKPKLADDEDDEGREGAARFSDGDDGGYNSDASSEQEEDAESREQKAHVQHLKEMARLARRKNLRQQQQPRRGAERLQHSNADVHLLTLAYLTDAGTARRDQFQQATLDALQELQTVLDRVGSDADSRRRQREESGSSQ
jgi:hypothetical protein